MNWSYHPTLSIPAVFSKSARSFRIIIPRQRSPIHCYYASTAPPVFTNSLLLLLLLLLPLHRSLARKISIVSLLHYLTFSTNGELSILPPRISISRARRGEGKPLLCFCMSRATVMDAFTRVCRSNQSLPAAPPNTENAEKPECL